MPKLAKLSSKNQITLPKEIVSHYPDTAYFEVREAGHEIVLSPVKTISAAQRSAARQTFDDIQAHFEREGITQKDVEDAVRWAKKNRPQ